MHCRQICLKYEKNLETKNDGLYENGQKRCSFCEIFIFYDGMNCPCCGKQLRVRPKNTSSKKRMYMKNILKNFQRKLNLNPEIAQITEKLFKELNSKFSFQFSSVQYIIAICVFLASRNGEQAISLKRLSELFELNQETLEIYCHLALDEIKPNLLKL